MVKSRSRDQKNTVIIESEAFSLKIFIKMIATFIMWFYSIFVFLLFFTAIIDWNWEPIVWAKSFLQINDVLLRKLLFSTIIIWLLFFILLWIWRIYNKRRFGSLNRRKYPSKTTDTDMLRLNLMSVKDYETLTKSKITHFENNPLRHIQD